MSPGGVLLPDEIRKRAGRGMIVAVGPGGRKAFTEDEFVPLEVEVGDVIVWDASTHGVVLMLNGEELVLLTEACIQAVIEEVRDEVPGRR